MNYIGLRVKILDVNGMVWHGLRIATGHPEYVGKRGTIVCEEDGVPVIDLDDGNTVKGSECWWVSVKVAEEVEKMVVESPPTGGR